MFEMMIGMGIRERKELKRCVERYDYGFFLFKSVKSRVAIHGSLAHSIAGNYEPNFALTPLKLIERLENLYQN